MKRRDQEYTRLMNSREWRALRQQKLEANPLCELCEAEGLVRSAQCIHHIVPIESGRTEAECRELAFRWTNLQSLCREHHNEVHRQMGKDTAENYQQRQQAAVERWLERHRKSKKF